MPDTITKPDFRRVGHKGAHAISPGNTIESFDAALAAGVDMIEFDILPRNPRDPTSELVLAHDGGDLTSGRPLVGLAEALAHFSASHYEGIELDVDLKLPNYEVRVAEQIRDYGLTDRVLVTSMYAESLDAVRALIPEMRVGWSVPKASRDWTQNPLTLLPALAMLTYLRTVLPGRVAERIRSGRIDCVMSHYLFATKRMKDAVEAAGGELFVWTVDDAKRIQSLIELGVDGIITNDPRLFDNLPISR
ncbi:MAG: glycerophosphodiester phosphodiesterase [Actinomycetes bacterium]